MKPAKLADLEKAVLQYARSFSPSNEVLPRYRENAPGHPPARKVPIYNRRQGPHVSRACRRVADGVIAAVGVGRKFITDARYGCRRRKKAAGRRPEDIHCCSRGPAPCLTTHRRQTSEVLTCQPVTHALPYFRDAEIEDLEESAFLRLLRHMTAGGSCRSSCPIGWSQIWAISRDDVMPEHWLESRKRASARSIVSVQRGGPFRRDVARVFAKLGTGPRKADFLARSPGDTP